MPIISNILIEPGTGTKIVSEESTAGASANTATSEVTVTTSLPVHTHTISEVNGLQSALDGKANASHTHTAAEITNITAMIAAAIASSTDLANKANKIHNHSVSDITGLSTVAATGSYADLIDRPLLGSAASMSVPASGNAATSQIVKGDDSRLTDARTPTPHSHAVTIGDGTSTRIQMQNTEQLNFVAGSNITLGFDDATNRITIASTQTDSAARLTTPRLIKVAGAVSGAVTFDGSADVTISTTLSGSHSHAIAEVTGLQTTLDTKISATYFSSIGDSIAKAIDQSTARTVLGLGTIATRSDSEFTPASHIGSGGNTHATASASAHGFMSMTDKSKLDGIAANASANSTDAFLLSRANHTGTQAIATINGLQLALDSKSDATHSHAIASATSAGFLSIADKTKLDALPENASANSSDTFLLNRANHTGTQPANTIIGLATVATSGNFADLTNKPQLGSSSVYDVANIGDATISQVVKGNDTRLTDARTPLAHNHNITIGDGTLGKITFGNNEALHFVAGANVAITYDDVANKITIATSGTISGTVDSAAKLSTGRTISLTGGVTGSVVFDGSSNVSISTSLSTHNHVISEVTGLQTALDAKASTAIATTTTAGLLSSADKTKLDGIPANATTNSSDTFLLNRANHTGTQAIATITGLQTALDGKASTAIATTTTDGLLSAADKTKLDGITGSGATYSNATTTTAGLMSSADKVKLDGIVVNATANSTDAFLLNRANHTGTQSASTITGLATVATSGNYVDLSNKPTLGSSAALDVASTGNASAVQVVKGNDTRLTDSRTPLAHNHTISIGDGTSGRVSVGTDETFHMVAGANVSLTFDDVTNKVTISTSGTISGTVDSANKLSTGRTISLTGSVTGAVVFDGSSNVAIATTLAAHTHTIAEVTGLQTALDSKASTAVVTTTTAGLMSAADKTKLDGITGSGATYSNATTTTAGLMSATDKTKVDGMATVATSGDYADLVNKPVITKFYAQDATPVGASTGDRWFSYATGILLTFIDTVWMEL